MALPTFSKELAELERIRKGWSRDTLAGEAGIAGETVRRIETGEVVPRIGTVAKLAAALGLDVLDLMVTQDEVAA